MVSECMQSREDRLMNNGKNYNQSSIQPPTHPPTHPVRRDINNLQQNFPHTLKSLRLFQPLGVDHSDVVMRRHTVQTLGLFQSHFQVVSVASGHQGMLPNSFFEIPFRNSLLFQLNQSLCFRRPIWLHSWHFYLNHATKELFHGTDA